MPRPSKGPYLELKRYRDGRKPMWVIRHSGDRTKSTGCDERDRDGANRALAEFILAQHNPEEAISNCDPNQAKIADVLSIEMKLIDKREIEEHRKRELIKVCQRVGNWFAANGVELVGQLNGQIQRKYAEERPRAAAYRDLKILAAAINRHITEEFGGVQTKFRPVLPEASQPRKGYFKRRDEAARFIWTAWRKRHKTTGEYAWRHIARYTLVGLYSGSRNGDICKAALMPTIGRGYVDSETGIFKRKPDNKKETSKRQPTVPIHPNLLAHIRRWKRKGIAKNSVIEFRGKPVGVVKEAWRTIAEEAGFSVDKHDPEKIIRHSARHTAISWYLTGLHNREQPVKGQGRRPGKGVDIEQVSQYCGVSVKVIREHYRHETESTYDDLLGRRGSA
jgi:hypothetical protein